MRLSAKTFACWQICANFNIFSNKSQQKKEADPPGRSSPLWCVAKSQSLWHYCPVVDADVINQAGEQGHGLKIVSGTEVQIAVARYCE